MQKFIREFNRRFPVLKNTYYANYSSLKSFYFNSRLKLGILRPRWVQWLVTYNCNFKCVHCEANAGKIKADELTTPQILRAIDDMAKLKTRLLSFSGGEPLLRKNLFDIIAYVKKKGMNYGIATNCSLVQDNLENFKKSLPSYVFTSIDGLEHSHDKFRQAEGSFKMVFEAIRSLKAIGLKHATINTFVYPGNFVELEPLFRIIINSGATKWRLSVAIPVGRAKSDDSMYLNDKQFDGLFNFIYESRKNFRVEITEDTGFLGPWERVLRPDAFFCGAGFYRCSIMPDGEVLGCQIAYDNRFSEGNIKTRSFSDIWENGFKRFRNPDFKEHSNCLDCKYFHACRGGCWGMRLGNRHCLKNVWENNGHVCAKH